MIFCGLKISLSNFPQKASFTLKSIGQVHNLLPRLLPGNFRRSMDTSFIPVPVQPKFLDRRRLSSFYDRFSAISRRIYGRSKISICIF